jgi:hypothetical protein
MPRRRRRPSELRCLVPLLTGLPALLMPWFAQSLMNIACRPAVQSCSQLPGWLVGLAYSAYRYYRDFIKGDYYIDLAEAGYL